MLFPSAILVYSDLADSSKWQSETSANQNDKPTACWSYPEGTCSVLTVLHNFCVFNSAWLVAVISIDRNFAIARPFRRPLSVRQSAIINAVVAICSLSIALASVLLANELTCYTLYVYNLSEAMMSWLPVVLFYFLPVGILIIMYCKIYGYAQVARSQTSLGAIQVWTVDSSVPDGHHHQRFKPANKALRTLLLTVGLYVVLWSPYWCYPLIHYLKNPVQNTSPVSPIGFKPNPCTPTIPYILNEGSTVMTWLMFASISIHPLLYSLLDRTVRSEIQRKAKGVRFRARRNRPTSTLRQQSNVTRNPESFWEFLESSHSI